MKENWKGALTVDAQEKIEKILDKKVDFSRFHSVHSFANFTDLDMQDLQCLWDKEGQLCIDYLEFLLQNDESLSVMKSFCSTVVQQRVPVGKWLAWIETLH